MPRYAVDTRDACTQRLVEGPEELSGPRFFVLEADSPKEALDRGRQLDIAHRRTISLRRLLAAPVWSLSDLYDDWRGGHANVQDRP